MKKILVSIAVGIGVLLPLAASAETVEEITAQVQALLSQIQELQSQLTGSTDVGVQTPGTGGGGDATCPTITRNLSRGSTGEDVAALQLFLSKDSSAAYTSGTTGFFGAATERAVQNFQSAYGVISYGNPSTTGYGAVGARTRRAISERCVKKELSCRIAPKPETSCPSGWQAVTDAYGCTTSYNCVVSMNQTVFDPGQPVVTTPVNTSSCGAGFALQCPAGKHDVVNADCSHSCVLNTTTSTGTSGGALGVSPTAGNAPLLVTFTVSANDSSDTSGVYYSIVFGDGQSGGFPRTASPVLQHTYTSAGTFTAIVTRNTQCTGTSCSGSLSQYGTATITIGSGSNGSSASFFASPTSGMPPLTVNFSGNYFGSSYTLNFGDGTTPAVAGCNTAGCTSAWNTLNLSHTYSTFGTFTATLTPGCVAGSGCNTNPVTALITIATDTPAITVRMLANSISQGNGIGISWGSQNAPSGSAVGLWLLDSGGVNRGLIAGVKAQTGDFVWDVPLGQCDNVGNNCRVVTDSPTVWYTSPGPYSILARLYTPSYAYLSGNAVNPTYPTWIASSTSGSFSIVSQ